MSVEGIIERILSEAQMQAEEIKKQAGQRVSAVIEEGKREALQYYEKQKKRLEDKYNQEKEHAVLNRRLQQRKQILEARQKWMDKAFKAAFNKLVEQPFSEYRELMKKLIHRVSVTKDEAVVFGAKGEDKELQKLIDELNSEAKSSFTLSKERGKFSWGFILKRGKIETSMSIDSLFRYKRNDLEQKAWELFNAS